ncbi:MAG: hypothetical protein Kow0029_27910 [Candidatus Rifleibacteriota bacterium]
MHAFFKPVLFVFVALALFFYIFSCSGTLETTSELVTDNRGLPHRITHYHFHWDRFFDYIIKTPERMKKLFAGSE